MAAGFAQNEMPKKKATFRHVCQLLFIRRESSRPAHTKGVNSLRTHGYQGSSQIFLPHFITPNITVPSENRQKLRADELRREYYEEQRNEFENFVEEQNDEQEERSQEAIEQWRQWHYDGLYPSYLDNRHHI
ncbi:unique cartilage matrix-associated protein-like [Meles meles]|uniref:unique cartilage matrix-associated protein-like n=1 Tax=Meles meles TaxID=9662 RepID=UPI001E69DD41|nr:unique cartilage matrix-associated protein-like [Meles meles]